MFDYVGEYYSKKDYQIDFFKKIDSFKEEHFSVGYNPNAKYYCYSEEEGYSEDRIKNLIQENKQNKFLELTRGLKLSFFYDLKVIEQIDGELFYYFDDKYIIFCNLSTIFYTYIDVLYFVSEYYKTSLKQILKQKNIIKYSDYKLIYYTNNGYFDFNFYLKKWSRNFDIRYFPLFLYKDYLQIENKDFKNLKRAKYVEDKLSDTFINIRGLGNIKLKYEGVSKVTGRIFCKDERIYIQGLTKEEKRELILPINEGDEIIEFDFSSFEYRILYQILGIELNYDPHLETAKRLLGDISKRTEAKNLNFKILYGGNIDDFKIKLNDGQLNYLENKLLIPRKTLNDKLLEEYNKNNNIKNYFGRIILPKKINGLLSNYISSTASDIIIYKMILLYQLLKNKKTRILTQIFDSIIINVDKDEKDLIDDIEKTLISNYKGFNFNIEKQYLKENFEK
jgi:hypothetical protein